MHRTLLQGGLFLSVYEYPSHIAPERSHQALDVLTPDEVYFRLPHPFKEAVSDPLLTPRWLRVYCASQAVKTMGATAACRSAPSTQGSNSEYLRSDHPIPTTVEYAAPISAMRLAHERPA